MGKPASQRGYEFGEFRLDADHLMLYRGDEEISLPPKAIETLLVLIERSGEIVRKDELLCAVWPDTFVEESNLFRYLHVLRKALGNQKNGSPFIETLRRRGYRFNANARVVLTTGRGPLIAKPDYGKHNLRFIFLLIICVILTAASLLALLYLIGGKKTRARDDSFRTYSDIPSTPRR